MKVTRENNTFIRQDGRFGDKGIKTEYQFKDLNGILYNVYIFLLEKMLIIKK